MFGEAYTRTEYERFPLGTVENPIAEPVVLSAISTPTAAAFRLKVVDRRTVHGTILAEADKLTPRLPEEDPGQRQSLLHVRPEDLGEQVWQLVVDGETPGIQVNKNLPDWRSEARSTRFVALVYPAVMRQLLTDALVEPGVDLEDGDDWRARWLQFAREQLGAEEAPSEESPWEDKRVWIEQAVQRFCSHWETWSKYLTMIDPEHRNES